MLILHVVNVILLFSFSLTYLASLWVLLNRIRSGYGRFAYHMHRIGLRDNPNCVCGDIPKRPIMF